MSFHDSLAGGMHQGFERTYAALRQKYYWPTMFEDCRKYIQSCEMCQRVKRDIHGKPPPLQPMPVADLFQRWHIDILGGLPTTKDKYKYVPLVVDSYSKWCEAFPLRTQEATEVAAVLFREVICRYGAPNVLVSDRGQQFLSKLVKALCELFQITRYYTSSYRPQLNGSVERMNSVILQSLRLYCKGKQDDWPELLPSIMMAYRMTPVTQSTKYSPFFLLFGREMRLPVDTALTPKCTLSADFRIHLAQLLQNLEISRKIAAKNIENAQEKYKSQYDKRSQSPNYQPADRVWLYCTKVPPGMAPKLHRKWVGPYYISHTGPNNTFKIRKCSDNKEVKAMINATRLKTYHDPADRPTNPQPGYENSQEQLNAEEIPSQQPPNTHETQQPSTSNKGKQPLNKKSQAKSSKTKSKDKVQQPDNANTNMKTTDNNSTSSTASTSSREKKTVRFQDPLIQQTPVPSTSNTQNNQELTPSANQHITSQPSTANQKFNIEDIDKILSSQRSKDTLYYKVKWKDPSKGNTWEYATSIPEVFIREFHITKTAKGRTRKRALKNHKFFVKDPSVSLCQDHSKKNYMIGYEETYTLSNQKLLLFEPKINSTATVGVPFRIHERKVIMLPYLNTLFDVLQKANHEDWHSNIGIFDNGQKFEAKMVRAVITNDKKDPVESTFFKVFAVDSKEPVWLSIQQAPIKCVRQFLYRIAAKIKQPGKIFVSKKQLGQ